jgi:hypothetical protein
MLAHIAPRQVQAGLVSAHARVVAYDHMEYNGGDIDIDATHGYATVLTQFALLTVSVLYYQGLLEIQSAIANPFGNDSTDLSRRREQRIWRAEVGALQEAAECWAAARGSITRRGRCCHFSSPHSVLYGESP